MADYTIGVLQKADKVLKMIGKAYRPVTLTEIAKTTELPRNTVFRILKTFEEDGFVQQVKGVWSLDSRLWELVDRNIEIRLTRWKRAMEWERNRRDNSAKSRGNGQKSHT